MLRRRTSWLLALLLVLQSGTAAAHCLRRAEAAGGAILTICTPSGLRSVALPGHDDAPAALADGFCPACHALPAATPPEPPFLPPQTWAAAPPARAIPANEAPAPRARDPTHGPRAPPSRA